MTRLLRPLPALLVVGLAACGTDAPAATPTPPAATASAAPPATPVATPGAVGAVEPAPGSASRLFAANPGAIVVAIEAGHGGCLDWGVPDPQERGEAFSEKAITLAIARALADLVAADGAVPMLIRDGDEALAGDLHPPLNCHGDPFRDVNEDGFAGFGAGLPEGTRTRDELQARLDRANLARADVLVSLHVDSIADGAGNLLRIARTETFYTDETPWGVSATEPLAAAIQESLVASMEAVAGYSRQDRGINAHNLYVVAPPLFETSPERPDRLRQPTRGALMPAVLVEVGSITLPEEHELLLTDEGVAAAASGIFEGLVAWFGERPVAGRLELDGASIGVPPEAVPGEGPPFRAAPVGDGPLRVRVTNTGARAWPAGAQVVWGVEPSDAAYLYLPPGELVTDRLSLPALEPGESVVVEPDAGAPLPPGLAWFSLSVGGDTLADLGSPALQLASRAP